MKNESVDKKKSKPLDEDIQVKHKAIIELCRFKMDHYKIKTARCENSIIKYKAVIKRQEDEIDNIKLPATGGLNPYPYVKKDLDELRLDVELSRVTIRNQEENILINKELIKLYRGQTLVYERRLRGYEKQFSIESGREKKNP